MKPFDDLGYTLPRDGVAFPSPDGTFYHWTPVEETGGRKTKTLKADRQEYFLQIGATERPKYLRLCWCKGCPDLEITEFSQTVPAGTLVVETHGVAYPVRQEKQKS